MQRAVAGDQQPCPRDARKHLRHGIEEIRHSFFFHQASGKNQRGRLRCRMARNKGLDQVCPHRCDADRVCRDT